MFDKNTNVRQKYVYALYILHSNTVFKNDDVFDVFDVVFMYLM